MTAAKFVDLHIGDVVRLRKDHPCGGTDWSVVRLGADIGLRCHTCAHRILLPRSTLERRLKTIVSQAIPAEPTYEEKPNGEGSSTTAGERPAG